MKLVRDVGLRPVVQLLYSRRPGTPAASLPDDARSRQRVLVEGRARKDATELAARTADNRVVNFPGNPRLVGHYVEVDIVHAYPHSLRGQIVTSEGTSA
jgi:tRNA-2-methylthio-N6-dimethylallyladenosine synthase